MLHEPRSVVFWAEADDDAGRILKIPHLSILALFAFHILDCEVVAHPAYAWQSNETNRLIVPPDEATPPPASSLILGNSESVDSYISDRISRLHDLATRSRQSESELEQYVKHGSRRERDVRFLDEHFTEQKKIHSIGWSRDAGFRQLVRADLSDRRPLGIHLSAHIRLCNTNLTTHQASDLIALLMDFVSDERHFVNVDSIIALLDNWGFKGSTESIFNRLHILHWQSHQGGNLQVPLLNRIEGKNLNPNDSVVFWKVMNGFFGPELQARVASASWTECNSLIAMTKGDILLQSVIATYRDIVEVVNSDDGEIQALIVSKKLAEKYPSQFRDVITAKLSTFGRISVISTLIGLTATSVSTPMGFVALGGTIGTLGDYIWAMWKNHLYHATEGKAALKARIIRLLEET